MEAIAGFIFFGVIVLAFVALFGFRVVKQWERGVVFRLGRLRGQREPGLRWVIPLVDEMKKVNLQVMTMDVQPQDVITKDNVTVRVDAVVYFQVKDPIAAIVNIQNYLFAISRVAQTTLRMALGQHELDDMLAHRAAINEQLEVALDARTEEWGIKVVAVETKDVDLPDSMQRAMARQAEAERERRAKIIAAEGEFQASEKLAQAAEMIGRQPAALQLRTLQTLAEVATEKNSTMIFPIPMELLGAIERLGGGAQSAS